MSLYGLVAVMLGSIILRRNVRPTGTILVAKLRVPNRERRSCSMEEDRLAHAWSERMICCSLPGERRALSAWESRRIPRYSLQVVGPSRLSSARGTLRAEQREVRVWRWFSHWSDAG